jgi:hypothetical protein
MQVDVADGEQHLSLRVENIAEEAKIRLKYNHGWQGCDPQHNFGG